MTVTNSEVKLVVYSTVPPDHALAYLRYRATAEQLGWTIILGKEGDNIVYPQRVEEADFVLIQRDFPRFFNDYLQVVQEARKKSIPILYDLDDAIFTLPEDHPLRGDYRDCLENILIGLIDADLILVSSELLAELVAPFNSHVVKWQTYLPDLIWKIKPPLLKTNSFPIRIGYMGGMTHAPDLEILNSTLQQISIEWGENVEFHFWGCRPDYPLAEQVYVHNETEIHDYRAFAKVFMQAEAEIWLSPLQESLFNRCKSSIKFWEYSAIGGVGVFSRLPPYETVIRHGENGFLADSPEEWLQYIRFLIQNPERRYQMAQQAQQTLLRDGLLSGHISDWEHAFRTTLPKNQPSGKITPFQQAVYQFASQIQKRSKEKEHQTIRLIQEYHHIENELSRLHEYLRLLERRSMQLDDIYNSRSWKLIQLINKIRHLDFRPIEPPSLPIPPKPDPESQAKNLSHDK